MDDMLSSGADGTSLRAEEVDLGSPQRSKLAHSHRRISVGLIPLRGNVRQSQVLVLQILS